MVLRPFKAAGNAQEKAKTITLSSSDRSNFRSITKALEYYKIKYRTNQNAEDRDLIVIIRGVAENLNEESISNELKSKDHPVHLVHRMRKSDKIWPLVAVH